ncbi:MAG: class I SAM-dependent DNA methyltransferase, partial [Gammaproteobacteria bacterium]
RQTWGAPQVAPGMREVEQSAGSTPPLLVVESRGDHLPRARWRRCYSGSPVREDLAMGEGFSSLSEAWERHAADWARWTRVPGHDVYHEQLNWPAFRELVPQPGKRTLDLGCGEGRVGRVLHADGHRMVGIDSSPTLLRLAREAGGYDELVRGDAAALPWAARTFDLAIAYMSLQDVDDLWAAVAELARVLEAGGRLCVAIVHPLNRSPAALDDYFEEQRVVDEFERDGLRMTFESIDRPLEAYSRALAGAGFLTEELREPRPTAAVLASEPRLSKADKRPYFLHMRCVLAGGD